MTGLNPTDTWETQSRPNGEKKQTNRISKLDLKGWETENEMKS